MTPQDQHHSPQHTPPSGPESGPRPGSEPSLPAGAEAVLASLPGFLADTTNVSVLATDADGCVTWCNAGFSRVSGYTLDEMLGKRPGDVLQGPGTDPSTKRYMRERLDAGRGFEAEILNYARDGRPYWLNLEVHPLRDADGSIKGFLAIQHDVTRHKAVERDLMSRSSQQSALARIGRLALSGSPAEELRREAVAAIVSTTGVPIAAVARPDAVTGRASLLSAAGPVGSAGTTIGGRLAEQVVRACDGLAPATFTDLQDETTQVRSGVIVPLGLADAGGPDRAAPSAQNSADRVGSDGGHNNGSAPAPAVAREALCLFSTVPGAGFAEHLPFVQSIADGLAQALARLDAERRLRELSQQLEHRVDERTHELSEANRKLEAEVAERRKAEEKIRGSQQFLQSSLDALSAHVAILDDEGAIIAVNRAWKRFGADNAGSDGTGGVGANYLNVCERAADARVPEASLMLRGLREVLARQRESFYLEYPCNAPDEERWFQVRASRFEVGGHNRVVVAHENITETKIAERRMREHMEKLGHVHRLETLGEMSAALAHELNQPLAAIANYASGCIRRMENVEGVSPDVMDAMGQVRREAERAAEIIKRMRKFARSQSLQRSPHHVRDIVLETVQLLEPDMRAKGARIRAAAPATTPLVLVDAIHVQQVLINLVRNAVDASAEVPEDERVIAIDVEGPTDGENFVTVGVTDPGCGIDDDTMDRLFDPFVTTKAHGMGLGLAISRSIIDAHNGRIWARRNDAGAGTSVLFTLPVCQPSQLAAPASGG